MMQDRKGPDSGYPVPGTPAPSPHLNNFNRILPPLPYCLTALLPYCLTALLPYCPTALLPYCPIARLPDSHSVTA